MNKIGLFFTFWLFFSVINPVDAQQPKKIRTIIVDAGHGGADFGAVGQYENSLGSFEKDVTLGISMKLIDELKRQIPDIKVIPTRTTDVYQSPKEKAQIANENKGDLFLCIHADSGPLKTGRRQIGTRTVTRHKVSYVKKGKKKKKVSTPYTAEEPIYETYKLPLTRNGTSVWIFAAHKTSDKLRAIMKETGESETDFQIEAGQEDTLSNPIDFNTPEGRTIAQIYAKRYQEKSDLLATYVNDEVEKTNRPALGINQRQMGIWVLQATNMPAILVETGFINNPEDERYISSEEGQKELAQCIAKAVLRYKNVVENNTSYKP
jgi:N-acetylmuramoyl-L-alanine amidase